MGGYSFYDTNKVFWSCAICDSSKMPNSKKEEMKDVNIKGESFEKIFQSYHYPGKKKRFYRIMGRAKLKTRGGISMKKIKRKLRKFFFAVAVSITAQMICEIAVAIFKSRH